MLHVTNGAAVGDTLAGVVDGRIVSWDDILHDGPVPGTLSAAELRSTRARFIAERGWEDVTAAEHRFAERDAALEAEAQEIVLWFEHDLYDQLQLLQILDRLADATGSNRVMLIQSDTYLGPLNAGELAALFPTRRVITERDLSSAAEAWAAFTQPDPHWIARLAARTDLPLPYVAPALRRLLEQFPGEANGLSRSERLILNAVAAGAITPATAFLHSQKRDQPYFLGDTCFAWYLERMAAAPAPLIVRADRAPLTPPDGPDAGFWHAALELTETGEAVHNGDADWVMLQGLDRWYGGVHLEGHFTRWRWDAARGLVDAA
jgi:hypothetical protein